MKISRNNYEPFFLDYYEGNLDAVSKRDLMDFLATNSDLKEEFESFENVSLTVDENLVFGNKEILKKNLINAENYQRWLVAFVEDDLTPVQQQEVGTFLEKNPSHASELEILKHTRILPDYSIRFENKASLKKGGVLIPMWVRVAAAAMVVFGVFTYWVLRTPVAVQIANKEIPHAQINPLPVIIKEEPAKTIKALVMTPPKQIAASGTKKMKSVKNPPNQMPPVNMVAEEKPSVVALQPEQKETAQAAQPEDDLKIVFHSSGAAKTAEQGKAFVALDDQDLTELGLQNKDSSSPSFVQSAVNGTGNFLGINMKYSTKNDLVRESSKTTFALGPVEISQTIRR